MVVDGDQRVLRGRDDGNDMMWVPINSEYWFCIICSIRICVLVLSFLSFISFIIIKYCILFCISCYMHTHTHTHTQTRAYKSIETSSKQTTTLTLTTTVTYVIENSNNDFFIQSFENDVI